MTARHRYHVSISFVGFHAKCIMELQLMLSWSNMRYQLEIKVDFLQSFSASSVYSWDMVLCPSLLIWNKLSNEVSAILVAQLVLLELKKVCLKSWRTWVRTDISSTFRRFELMSVRTNVLTPILDWWFLHSGSISPDKIKLL